MARFAGKVGFGETVNRGNGVWEDVMSERPYYGDVVRNRTAFDGSEKVNEDLRISHSISIVADAFAVDHMFAIRYVQWAGSRWIVTAVEIQRPRLLLQLGGVYNGPTPVETP